MVEMSRCRASFMLLTLCFFVLAENVNSSGEQSPAGDSEDVLNIGEVLQPHASRVRRSNTDRRSRIAETLRRRYRSPFPRPGHDAMQADNAETKTIRCGEVEIDVSGALCCDGIVYGRQAGVEMRCCGRVAYDEAYFDCCGPRHRDQVTVRRAPVMPACCDDRSDVECPRNADGPNHESLGSVCCQVPGAGDASGRGGGEWRCCLRQDGCCDGVASVSTVDVPGYRPACCEVDRRVAARCCAETYQSVGLLPHCCDDDTLRPICCRRSDGSTRCCPANEGYCCGQNERPLSRETRRRPAERSNGQQSDEAVRGGLQPRTGTDGTGGQQYQQQQRERDPTYDRRRYNGDRYPTAAAPVDRNRYDTRDRYPTEPVPVVDSGGSDVDEANSNSTAPTCCVNPSRRCCPSNTNGRGQTPPCCRPVACRPASFSASRCPPRYGGCPSGGPGQGSGCPQSRCAGQGSGCPSCPGQGSGCPGQGGGCPGQGRGCPGQGGGCPGQGGGCPGQGGGCAGQGAGCPGQGGGCPGQGGGCPGQSGGCPGQGGGCPGQGGGGCPPPC